MPDDTARRTAATKRSQMILDEINAPLSPMRELVMRCLLMAAPALVVLAICLAAIFAWRTVGASISIH